MLVGKTSCSWLFYGGQQGRNESNMQKTLDFAMKLNPDTAQFFPLIPYPGTEAFIWAKENGYLKTLNMINGLTSDGLHECVLNLPNLSSEELLKFCDDARKKILFKTNVHV